MLDEKQDVEAESSVWQIGIFDGHCHPTEYMDLAKDIGKMKAKALTIMASRQQDQELVEHLAVKFPAGSDPGENHACYIIPAFGWHPWSSHEVFDDRDSSSQSPPGRRDHYRRVLSPEPEDENFLDSLAAPYPLSEFLAETEARLRRHPFALIGEVGLDRAFRLPVAASQHGDNSAASVSVGGESSKTPGSRAGRSLSPYRVSVEHQKALLKAQLQLAGKLRRPVSIHSVQAHGLVYEMLKELWAGHEKPSKRSQKRRKSANGAHDAQDVEELEESTDSAPLPYPPRICLHSYTGPSDALRQFLHSSVPADVYFSFSDVINFSSAASKKVSEVIKTVPASHILIESDFDRAGEEMDDRLEAILHRVCEIKKWPLKEGAEQLRTNWHRFVFGRD